MKELSIEEKAKRYDKAIDKAKKELDACGSQDCDAARQIFRLFSELKESEDEIVIAALKSGINGLLKEEYHLKGIGGISFNKINAWLEKQGNPTDINPSEFDLRLNKLLKQFETLPKEELASSLSFYLNVVQNDGTYKEEKQGEQKHANKVEPKDYNGIDPYFGKPVDKVEPKFKVGDVVCDKSCTTLDKNVQPNYEIVDIKNGMYFCNEGVIPIEHQDQFELVAKKIEPKFKVGDWITNGAEKPSQISSIEDDMYYTHNGTIGGDIESMDKEYHLWTIQDAKEGDVLVNDHHILILKELDYDRNGTPSSVKVYCDIDPNGNFEISKDGWGFCVTLHIHPATNEQWDTLFVKMKEAGYEWDAEKKELKKISQRMISAEAKEAMYGNPTWSEEDEKAINDILWIIEAYRKDGFNETHIQMADNSEKWLKSIKQRIIE